MPKDKDPYLYAESDILINKFNIKDFHTLINIESRFFLKRHSQGIPDGKLDFDHLKKIHYHLFQDIYDWAGKERVVGITKGNSTFAHPQQISPYLNKVFLKLSEENHLKNINFTNFCERAAYYFGEINAVHPFREGNGRTQRLFLDKLAAQAGYKLSWNDVDYQQYTQASIDSFNGNHDLISEIFKKITNPILREQFLTTTLSSTSKNKHDQALGIEALTQSEAGQLYAAQDVDTIRNRIFVARENGITRTFSGERTKISDQSQRNTPLQENKKSDRLSHEISSDNINYPAHQKFNDILKEYIEKKSELSRLTHEKIRNMGVNAEAVKSFAKQSVILMKDIQKFSQNALKNSEIDEFIKHMKLSLMPIVRISKQGGFEGIEKRLKATGHLSEEEKKSIITSMKSEAQSLVQTQKFTQGRGGQKR
jgi:cell filamentation protein